MGPAPSASASMLSSFAWLLIPLGVLGIVICSKAFRRSVSDDAKSLRSTVSTSPVASASAETVATADSSALPADWGDVDWDAFSSRFPTDTDPS